MLMQLVLFKTFKLLFSSAIILDINSINSRLIHNFDKTMDLRTIHSSMHEPIELPILG